MGARTCLGALFGLACVAAAPLARGQDAAPSQPSVEAPPAPANREAELLVHVRAGAVIPLERSDVCPGEALCVLGAGADVGVEVERRWPMGFGVGVGYEAWFVDSGGVFELGTVQIVRAVLAYTFALDWSVHPRIHLGAGALVLGDTFSVSTVGGTLDFGSTLEIELTSEVALFFEASTTFFTTAPFTTSRDLTLRAEGLGINAALQLGLGLSILAETDGS